MIWWVRLGRAELRRHKVRSALIVAFVAVPVMAMTVAAVLVASRGTPTGLSVATSTSSACAPQPVRPGPTGVCDPEAVAGAAAAVPDSVPHGLGSLGEVFVERNGRVESFPVAELDEPERVFGPVSILREGRYPTGPGEVALTRQQLELVGASVGRPMVLGVPTVEVQVVGEITGPAGGMALAAAGTFPAPTGDIAGETAEPRRNGSSDGTTERRAPMVFSLIDLDTAALDQLTASGGGIAGLDPDQISTGFYGSNSDSQDNPLALVPLVGTAALFWLGLVAATGLAIGARRRRREFGLLVANGADPGQLRLAALSEALVLGVVGAWLGAGFGLVVANRWTPWVQYRLDLVADTVVVPWATVLLCAALGVAAATIAGDAATRALRRQTPSDLLRGVPLSTRPAHRWFLVGALCWAVAGLTYAAWFGSDGGASGWVSSSGEDTSAYAIGTSATPFSNGGTALVAAVGVIGLVALVVGSVRLLGRLTARLPVTWRLAGADLSRHGARVATATAAISLTLFGAAWAGAAQSSRLTGAADGGSEGTSLAQVSLSRSDIVDGRLVSRPTADADLVVSRLDELGTPPVVVDELTCASWVCDWISPVALHGADSDPAQALQRLETLSPDAALAVSEGSIALPVYAMSWIDEPNELLPTTPRADGGVDLDIGGTTIPVQPVPDLQETIVPESVTAELGMERTGARSLLVPPVPPELVDEVNAVLGRAGAGTLPYDPTSGDRVRRLVMGSVALVVAALALLISALALALLRAESVEEDRALAEVGATPMRRRSVHAARGALVMLVAGVPATVAAAYLSAVRDGGPLLGLPWWVPVFILVVLPAAAWAANVVVARPRSWDPRATA